MKEPEKILKKIKAPNGQIRYQVKWKGFEEPTWEPEELLQKHRELIEDYNFFALTGDRYDEKKLDEIRQMSQSNTNNNNNNIPSAPQSQTNTHPRTAIKRVSAPKPYNSETESKKEKKTEKMDGKIQAPEPIVEDQKEKAIENQTAMILSHQNNHKISSILSQKQQELTKKLASTYATTEDKIAIIKLQLTDDSCVFQIQWQIREDGSTPYPEFYQYDQFKLLAPLLYIQFVETCLLECETKDSEIKFEGPGKDFLERIELIREVLGDRQTAQ